MYLLFVLPSFFFMSDTVAKVGKVAMPFLWSATQKQREQKSWLGVWLTGQKTIITKLAKAEVVLWLNSQNFWEYLDI